MTTKSLTPDQVNAAICTLASWAQVSMSDDERAAWRIALRSYHTGEFGRCIDAWARTEWGKRRPTIGDLAQFLDRPESPSRHPDYVPIPTVPTDTRSRSLSAMERVLSAHAALMPSRRGMPQSVNQPEGAR